MIKCLRDAFWVFSRASPLASQINKAFLVVLLQVIARWGGLAPQIFHFRDSGLILIENFQFAADWGYDFDWGGGVGRQVAGRKLPPLAGLAGRCLKIFTLIDAGGLCVWIVAFFLIVNRRGGLVSRTKGTTKKTFFLFLDEYLSSCTRLGRCGR